MKKDISHIVLSVGVLFFVGCSSKVESPKKQLPKIEPSFSTVKAHSIQDLIEEPELKPIFADTHLQRGSLKTLIDTLDAFSWEKKAMHKVYSERGNLLWSDKQIADFRFILEQDSYLSLCGDKRYWDYLATTQERAKQDILYSILLLRYLNNLASGCSAWVVSDGKIYNENSMETIKSEYLLSMLTRGALIEKLFLPYFPKDTQFFTALKQYKRAQQGVQNGDELKEERLYIEQYKMIEQHPTYE